jgi:hypothetical protein
VKAKFWELLKDKIGSLMKSVVSLLMILVSANAFALSVDWAGNYRFEYVEVDKPALEDFAGGPVRKSYMLNYLSLSPKIIAADGINIIAKFDVLPSDQYTASQTGQIFGRGPTRANSTGSSSFDDSAVAGRRQGSTNLVVNQLYLNVNQEYGALVVGRAPLEFGMGLSHSAGNGAFDHWFDSEDMVGYKVISGNLSIMPIFARVYDYSPAQGRDIQDFIWDVQYNSSESESSIGVMHQTRTAGPVANDAPAGSFGGTATTGSWKTQDVNLYFSKGFESVKFKMEAGFKSGGTGVTAPTTGDEIKLNGYGLAFELDFPRGEGKWHTKVRAGMASGDNPSTSNYEGFHFHRNYDVAFLLFNHPLGRYDLFRTAAQRAANRLVACAAPPCGTYGVDEALDDESISNATFLAPSFDYSMGEKWEWTNRFTWAQLQTNPLSNLNIDVDRNIGFEWDTGFVYRPHDKIMWVNEIGLLMPGAAWQGGTNNYGKGFTYGFTSKAAISF